MNSRFDNNEASLVWEHIAHDVKTGVEYLRRQERVRWVVLFGHSGGAATLSFYQAVAEKGTSYCDTPGKLTACARTCSATHNIEPCVECETRKGEYGNSMWSFFNYVRDWINQRFVREPGGS